MSIGFWLKPCFAGTSFNFCEWNGMRVKKAHLTYELTVEWHGQAVTCCDDPQGSYLPNMSCSTLRTSSLYSFNRLQLHLPQTFRGVFASPIGEVHSILPKSQHQKQKA